MIQSLLVVVTNIKNPCIVCYFMQTYDPMRMIGAIDLGSNAVRLALARPKGDSDIEIVESSRESVRLGMEVFSLGYITDISLKRLNHAFIHFKDVLEKHGVTNLRAVATSALREAKNRSQVVETIKKCSGIELEVISGQEEAELVHRAILQSVKLNSKVALLIDIGGGSIETTLVEEGSILDTESFKMGAVRLLSKLEETKIGEKNFNLLVKDGIENIRKMLKKTLGKRSIDIGICTGGNVDALADLRKELFSKSNDELKLSDLSELIDKLESKSVPERIKELHLRPDRADVILPAALVLHKIMKAVEIDSVLVPHVGVKEGVLLHMLDRANHKMEKEEYAQTIHSAKQLGRKYDFDELHAKTVARHAVSLFDQLQDVHELEVRYRVILETAALLHDIGYYISETGHHKHSYYLIWNANLLALSEKERSIVALVARYHRKSHPTSKHDVFNSLSTKDQIVVSKLAGMLRIADAMDRSHSAFVQEFKAVKSSGKLTLKLRGSHALLLEKWAILKKADLFEKAFELKINLEDAS